MNEEYFYYESSIMDGNMKLLTLTELGLVRKLMTKTVLFMVIIFIIITNIVVKMADYASKKKTESIGNIIQAIRRVQKGDLKAFVPLGQTDEFKLIGEQFNKMLVDLNQLMIKNSELIDRNRIAEIKQLESQFNPHFIFNTLETLKYMVHMDQEKASEIIVSFAVILRYSIDYEKKDIELDQDLDYLNSYLLIQKYRYNKRLTYDINIEKEAKDCIVPKLIMQPIIENCINHGYKSKENLHIIMNISIKNDQLICIVEDNGDGISAAKLQELKIQLGDISVANHRIGLNNVNRRLKLLYGESYGLEIKSEEKKGMKVIIKMPVNRW